MAQNIVVDIRTRGHNPVAYTHQGDTNRTFVFEIYENGEAFSLTGYTAKIGAVLPSDTGYYVIAGSSMATGTISDNTITATLTADYSRKAGNGLLTIILTNSSGSLRPINVDLRIQGSADGPDVIAGASDFPDTLNGFVDEWFDNNSDEYLDAWLTGALADQDLESVVNNWLDAHPEATTTVQDGAITYNKLNKEIKWYVTPEMFGAVGNGQIDDIEAITACFASGAKNVLMANKYFISEPITNIPNNCHVFGGGTIQATNSSAIKLDALRGTLIENLIINFSGVGLELTSTSGYSDYCEFKNLSFNGTDSTSDVGVKISRTTTFNNEHRFTEIEVWNCNYGFMVDNPDTSKEAASHRFLFCSAESMGTAGFYFKNSSFDTLLFCRIAEGNGAKIKTDGQCYRLTIVTESIVIQKEQPMSENTYGVIFGCFRAGTLYVHSVGGYAAINKGKIIPCAELRGATFEPEQLNQSALAPKIQDNGDISIYDSWYKYGNADTTLTLDPMYYGGQGKINDIYIYKAAWAGAITVTDGTVTKTFPQDNQNAHHYHLKYFLINNARVWRVEEYDLSL